MGKNLKTFKVISEEHAQNVKDLEKPLRREHCRFLERFESVSQERKTRVEVKELYAIQEKPYNLIKPSP